MSVEKGKDIRIKLTNVRLAFPELFVPKQVEEGKGKAAFSASFLLPPDHPDIPKIKAGIKQTAVAKWGEEAQDILSGLIAGDKVCLHNGNTKSQYDGFKGNMFVSARSPTRPTVLGQDKAPLVQADGKPYAGSYVNAIISLWAQQNKYGKRVNAQLAGVQFLRDGESFGGGTPADVDEFDTVEGDDADGDAPESTDDLTGGW